MILFAIIAISILIWSTGRQLGSSIFGGMDYPDIHKIQMEIHEYSGINQQMYMDYKTHMDLCMSRINDDPLMAAEYLYAALAYLRDIGLMIPGGDSGIPDILNNMADKLGKVTEKHIMIKSTHKGVRFNPFYLNNKFIDISEYA